MAYTRDCDWEEGSRPIVYQSLSRTALDLGVSERQIQKLETALFHAGAITWNDSGNHKRYGQRDPETGRLGVDLTPLAYLRETLEARLHEKKLYDDAWMETKRRISCLRRQVRSLLAEWEREEGGCRASITRFGARYDEIAVQIRTHLDLVALRELLTRHETLHSDLIDAMGVGDAKVEASVQRASSAKETPKSSRRSDHVFAHYKYTTQEKIEPCSPRDAGFQESVAERPEPSPPPTSSVPEHVTLGMALGAASERLSGFLKPDPGWADLVEAAYQLRRELGVSQASWGEACRVLGRNGAAVCLLVTDRAALRESDPVRHPAAYSRGMVRRAGEGDLRLHASLFGWLSR